MLLDFFPSSAAAADSWRQKASGTSLQLQFEGSDGIEKPEITSDNFCATVAVELH